MEKWCSSCISQKCDSCEILKAYMPTCKKCGSNCTDTINGECDRCIELRTTKRALWLARADRANDAQAPNSLYKYNAKHPKSTWNSLGFSATKIWEMKWKWVERKCREKAEEYK